ncbi:class I tRNA ligase family protein [Streptomyces sp. RTd22]|uniref:class I tRNA ligase family protein n=1 Tax=Streptomyces sp. RTd22 TaxID=1841249 RepID=UPI0007C4F626|nr:class I tRNA ligase family protein [Streptomyces sp. RTd22]
MSTPLWITATPPATHGELHIGHLAGPYVAADVLSRHLRADGRPVLFSTGTADHTESVELRALRAGRKPEEVAEGYRAAITADWLRSGVEFDHIVQPRRDRGYQRWVQNLFLDLYGQDVIVARTRLHPFCPSCERWLHGAFVMGACSACGARADGSLCHECARPTDADLIDPVCALCGSPGERHRCRRLYLPLEPLRESLADHWASTESSPRLAALWESLLEDGLPEVAVGHPGDWGVPVPVDDFRHHRIDACFEAVVMHLFGYGYDHKPLPERAVHFCEFGHAFCHAVLLPAILIARGVKLPQEIYVNETYRVDAERAHGFGGEAGVWALDLLTEFGSDTLRRHVLEERPHGRRTEFRRDRLERTRQVLETTWNNWLTRLFTAVREDCAGVVPDAEPGGTGWEALRRRLYRAAEDLREAYGPEAFDPRRAVAVLDEVVSCAADFGYVNVFEQRRPRRGGRRLPTITAQLSVAVALTSWAWPVMPEGAGRLAAALRTKPGGPVVPEALAPPAPGVRLDPPSGPVFGF